MLVDVKVPPFSESVTEGKLLAWSKHEGDRVERGDVLVGIETDKVVLEVNAQQAGVITSIKHHEGDTVEAHELLATIDTEAQATSAPASQASGAAPEGAHEILSPAVRRIVAESGVNPKEVAGTGRDGRLTKGDVIAHLESAPKAPAAVVPTAPVPSGDRPMQRVPMTRIRARIAERLKQAQNTAAILTTYNEVNMQPVMDLRRKYQDAFVKKHGVKLGFMSFFVKAATEALKQFPVINASVDAGDILYHGYFDVGIAVATERGLVVPVLRDTNAMSLADIEKEIAAYAEKARTNKLTLEDLSGGTFSITNGGTFGSLLSTPILNQPQSAILGMHNIQERPVAENGQVIIRPMMYVALSYDHRLIDGREAVLFLVTLKNLLEDPARFLLEI